MACPAIPPRPEGRGFSRKFVEAMEAVVSSYVLYTGSAQETPDMKRARTLMGEAMDKVRAELP
jgi:hypothetical protein